MNPDYVVNIKKLCFAIEFKLSVKELLNPFKTYMLVKNRVGISDNEEFEVGPGKKSTILHFFRKSIADTKSNLKRTCNSHYQMHISSTGNGSGGKGNKKEIPVSNDQKNENKKGNRALQKIYASGKFYIYIQKEFPIELTSFDFDFLEWHAETEKKVIWKIAFKGEDWNRWNKAFDISFWNQKYIEKEIMNGGTLLCNDGQTLIPFSISIPNDMTDSNDIEAHSTHLSDEDMSDLLQQSILNPERDDAQQELSNQSDSNETLEFYKTSHQHDPIQTCVEIFQKTHGDNEHFGS